MLVRFMEHLPKNAMIGNHYPGLEFSRLYKIIFNFSEQSYACS